MSERDARREQRQYEDRVLRKRGDHSIVVPALPWLEHERRLTAGTASVRFRALQPRLTLEARALSSRNPDGSWRLEHPREN